MGGFWALVLGGAGLGAFSILSPSQPAQPLASDVAPVTAEVEVETAEDAPEETVVVEAAPEPTPEIAVVPEVAVVPEAVTEPEVVAPAEEVVVATVSPDPAVAAVTPDPVVAAVTPEPVVAPSVVVPDEPAVQPEVIVAQTPVIEPAPVVAEAVEDTDTETQVVVAEPAPAPQVNAPAVEVENEFIAALAEQIVIEDTMRPIVEEENLLDTEQDILDAAEDPEPAPAPAPAPEPVAPEPAPQPTENAEDEETAPEDGLPDDAPALLRFAAPFENPLKLPVIGLVLLDDGTLSNGPALVLRSGLVATVALSALMDDATIWSEAYREAGSEVAMRVPLPDGATPADVEVAYAAALEVLPEAAMLFSDGNGVLRNNRSAGGQVMQVLASEGRGFVTVPRGLGSLVREAERAGVPVAGVVSELGVEGESVSTMMRILDRAAFRARQAGGGVVLAPLNVETLNVLSAWAQDAESNGFLMGPVSALLIEPAPEPEPEVTESDAETAPEEVSE
jgi:hypothetical protein